MLANVEISKDGDLWAVRREGANPAINKVGSLDEALEIGRQIAKQGGVSLVWEDEDGTAQQETYEQESGASTRGSGSTGH